MKIENNFFVSVTNINDKSEIYFFPELTNSFIFKIRNITITLVYSNDAIFVKNDDDKIIILFSGNIYQDDLLENESIGHYLMNKFLLFGKDFVKYLNGSFCLFFANINTGDVYFATDRLNTKKIFIFKSSNNFKFATNINYLPLNECQINYAGIASYFINGAIYNNLTLFDEINILDRASLHNIDGFNITSEKYWDYYFTNEFENRKENDLSDELNSIYHRSIKRRIKDKNNIFISLSGGYDSRGIAAILKENSNINSNILCFSHNFGDNIEGTDSGIAKHLSEFLGFNFKLFNSYNGNPFHTLKYNSELGQGLAYFCVESDAWEQINKECFNVENSILLVGDMNDGTFTEFHGNKKRALERTQIFESGFLKEFSNYFIPDIFGKLCDCYKVEYDKILNKVSNYEDMINLLDYLYIDQRIPFVNSIARECFQMPYVETSTPYYDNDVLEFMRKLPPHYRNKKYLHRIMLETKYPDIFNIAFPTKSWGNEVEWINEIKSFSQYFLNDINNSTSMLDKIIFSETIKKSIRNLHTSSETKEKDKNIFKSLHSLIKKILPNYYKIIEKIPGGKEFTRKVGKLVNPRITHILPKILILRMFLNKNSAL